MTKVGKVGSIGRTVNAVENTVETTRVGRWMSPEEYEKIVKTGKIQPPKNGSNLIQVTNPADKTAFKSFPSGSYFVEFDVPTDSLYPAGREIWSNIPGPDSTLGNRYGITDFPKVSNIELKDIKP